MSDELICSTCGKIVKDGNEAIKHSIENNYELNKSHNYFVVKKLLGGKTK